MKWKVSQRELGVLPEVLGNQRASFGDAAGDRAPPLEPGGRAPGIRAVAPHAAPRPAAIRLDQGHAGVVGTEQAAGGFRHQTNDALGIRVGGTLPHQLREGLGFGSTSI